MFVPTALTTWVTRERGVEMDEQTCRLTWLRPGCEEQYDALHRDPWPEITNRLKAAGISDYSIFRHGRMLISVLRRDTQADPVTLHRTAHGEWTRTLRPLFSTTHDEHGLPILASRVFRLD